MRLIDIDKHFELNEPFYKADIEMPLHRVKVALESLPTVKAIPIEWIKEYVDKYSLLGIISKEYEVLYAMIKDWEKENGTEESVRNTGI